MAYSVGFFQLKVQVVRNTAHAPSPTVVSVGFFEDMWIPLVHLPQPCALYVSFFPFPTLPSPAFMHHTADSFLWMHNAATPTNARISGYQAPKQHQPTNCSTLQKQSAFTSTRARSCACASRETSSATTSQDPQKRPRVSSSVDKCRLGVCHTR